ncbi:MAG: hypothetical protein JST90_03880 [Bacteroidetes bacterium]|nr:hypothetical protein [Bacteroidota bacterium]
MKKTLIKLCSVAAIGLALTACNNDAANKQAQDADNAAIDQMVQDKVKTLDDSLTKVCEDKVAMAAEEKLKNEPAPKAGGHAATHHATTPAKKDEPKAAPAPVDPKKDKMNGNANSNTNAETKKDKMSGNPNTNVNSDKKKSKMNGGN